MATHLENSGRISVASLVSNEVEEEGLLAIIRQSQDMNVGCHAIISRLPPTPSLFQLCDWSQIGVIAMMLPASIMEDAVTTFAQELPHIPLTAIITSPWTGADIVRLLKEGAQALTASMRAPVILNMIRLTYYHAGAVDIDMSQRAIRARMAFARHEPALNPLDRRIWSLLAQGYSNLQIATMLGISLSRTKHRIKHIFRYLDIHHRAEAIKLFDDSRH